VGVDGDLPGVAHHTAANETETKLVPDLHADLDGRLADRVVHNVHVRAEQQPVHHGEGGAEILRHPPVYHIRRLPDEDRVAADAVLQTGEPTPSAAHVLRVRARLDAHRLPHTRRVAVHLQTLRRLNRRTPLARIIFAKPIFRPAGRAPRACILGPWPFRVPFPLVIGHVLARSVK